MKLIEDSVSKQILKALNESEEVKTKLTEAFIYKNAEDGSTLNLDVTDKLTSSSAGEVIDINSLGKIAGLVKIQDTTYLITKEGESLYAYSIDTGFPFEFKFEKSDEFEN